MKKALLILLIIFFLGGCITVPTKTQTVAHKLEVSVAAESPQEVVIKEPGDGISKSMQIPNQSGTLSSLSFVLPAKGDKPAKGYIKIFSALSVGDVTNVWNDFIVLKHMGIVNVDVFINSPGGDAFSGLALADQIIRAKTEGFTVVAHASGIVASAAVPIFAVCNERIATPGTIFMVHETSIWKWPGRETHSDIKSQSKLLDMLRNRYIDKLINNSKLNKKEWEELEYKTTWFSAEKAKSWGLVDKIE